MKCINKKNIPFCSMMNERMNGFQKGMASPIIWAKNNNEFGAVE